MDTLKEWMMEKMPLKFFLFLLRKEFGKKDLLTFEKFLNYPNEWEKVNPDNEPNKWIFKKDNSFAIIEDEKHAEFTESWTKKFPDKKSFSYNVYLKINGELVTKHLVFIAVDGAKYFVPRPEIETENYFWKKKSIYYKVFKIIGNINEEEFIKFAKRAGVSIR